MSPGIARRVLASFYAHRDGSQADLTLRERQVLDLLIRGASYALIGQALEISTNTVQSHIRSIYDGRYNINVLLFRCARCVGGALWGGVWIAVRWGYRYDPPPRGAVAGAPAAMSQGHVHTGIRAG